MIQRIDATAASCSRSSDCSPAARATRCMNAPDRDLVAGTSASMAKNDISAAWPVVRCRATERLTVITSPRSSFTRVSRVRPYLKRMTSPPSRGYRSLLVRSTGEEPVGVARVIRGVP